MEAYIDLMRAHAPLLIVLTPLLGAALSFASPHARVSWVIACLAAWVTALLAGDLAYRALLAQAPLTPTLEGIALRLDGAGAFAMAWISAAGALVILMAGAVLGAEMQPRTAPFAFGLALCMLSGWCAAMLARDLLGVFAAVEMAWLAGVGLVALSAERARGALSGALRMLASGGVAGAFLLLGAGLVERGAGADDIAALADQQLAAPRLAALGVALMVFALALKAGIAPLNLWTGGAYGRAGRFAALALGVIGASGALAVLVRVSAFAMLPPAIAPGLSAALLALGLASVVIGSFQAVGARNLLRLGAYAAAAQAGCVLVSVALGSPAGFASALVQGLAQGIVALALFGGAAGLGGAQSLNALDGAARRAPLSSAAIAAASLSLMGAPLTLGFLGRWRLIEAGVGGGWWWSAGAVIVASLAAVVYGGRLIERLYFRRASTPGDITSSRWSLLTAPALVASIAAIAWALEPSLLLQAAASAAALLTGDGP